MRIHSAVAHLVKSPEVRAATPPVWSARTAHTAAAAGHAPPVQGCMGPGAASTLAACRAQRSSPQGSLPSNLCVAQAHARTHPHASLQHSRRLRCLSSSSCPPLLASSLSRPPQAKPRLELGMTGGKLLDVLGSRRANLRFFLQLDGAPGPCSDGGRQTLPQPPAHAAPAHQPCARPCGACAAWALLVWGAPLPMPCFKQVLRGGALVAHAPSPPPAPPAPWLNPSAWGGRDRCSRRPPTSSTPCCAQTCWGPSTSTWAHPRTSR